MIVMALDLRPAADQMGRVILNGNEEIRAWNNVLGTIIVASGAARPSFESHNLARAQKVDLAQISILQLVDQYTDYIANARALKLEIARTHETDRTERVRMVVREDTFTVEGGRDR